MKNLGTAAAAAAVAAVAVVVDWLKAELDAETWVLLHVVPASVPVYNNIHLSADIQWNWRVMDNISSTPSHSQNFHSINLSQQTE